MYIYEKLENTNLKSEKQASSDSVTEKRVLFISQICELVVFEHFKFSHQLAVHVGVSSLIVEMIVNPKKGH